MLNWSKVDPELLRKEFRDDVEKLLSKSPFSWYVTYGYRSLDEQKTLYDKYLSGGPKAAPPGKSAHNFGMAVDVVLDADATKPGLQPTWDTKLAGWLWLFVAIKAHPRLKSGVSFGDGGHIEVYKWENLK